MAEAWRAPFARFLKENAAVERGRVRFYGHWTDRLLASSRPGKDALASSTVSRFLYELGRGKEPSQVK